jgi:FkbM family methyltransferase
MTALRFYSQHGEDALLWQFFRARRHGFYVDVGAFDGRHLSTTYAFDQAGWRGLCVEALPDMAERCRSLRTATTVQAAAVASPDVHEVTFYSEALGLLSGMGLDPAREDDVRGRYERRGLDFDGFTAITVPAATLDALLERHLPQNTPLDFVSIDVEGAELDVLRGFDLKRWQPRVLIMETNTPQERAAMDVFLAPHGYQPARQLGVNTLYARSLRDVYRLRALEVRVRIAPSEHPHGPAFTAPEAASGFDAYYPPESVPRWTLAHLEQAVRRRLRRFLPK